MIGVQIIRRKEDIADRNSRHPHNNYDGCIKLDVCITIYFIEGKFVLQHFFLASFLLG